MSGFMLQGENPIKQNKNETNRAPSPPKSLHMSAGEGMSKGFWLPVHIRLLFQACQMPMMGTVCECHSEAHNQNKTYYSFNLELTNKFLYLFHEKSAKKTPTAAVSSSTQQ